MKRNEKSRRKIAAEQIAAAMKLRGLGKKQFAELMHRSPSEVTKWLSGGHNFTIALLQGKHPKKYILTK
ncbi:MAG: helix-turn-helix domain-containing protein [Candidatus Cryptobacteroides sp.]